MAESDCVDLLIVGGGINGAGIARDAAGRGLKVALVEQSDLAAGTSSASTKLIHGGLRYLEFFEFRLVRESLIERERLLRIAPHLVRPMQFILPHVPGLRPRWQIRFGLFFYDYFSGRRTLQPSRSVRVGTGAYGALRPGVDHAFAYSDCWVDDSRLVVLNALDAAQRGAAIHTRTRFVSATPDRGVWRARCLRQGSGESIEVRARAIVNAAGPWVEHVLKSFPNVDVAGSVRLVKGSHIVVPRLFAGKHAFMLQNPDGRIVFAIPYEQKWTLVGTTDVPFSGDPAHVRITDEEVRYLCNTINSYFQRQISPGDVRWTYAGIRPLFDDESKSASRVTRDYRIELAQSTQHPPLLSIFGGKLTTYRKLAETVLEKLQEPLGISPLHWTHRSPLPGGDLRARNFRRFVIDVRRRWRFLPITVARRLARAYGTRVEAIIGGAKSFADLGEHYGAGLTAAEVDYLVRNEWALTDEDILWRRSKLGLHMTEAERQHFAAAMSTRSSACA
ncbi:MAG TPA: glycerol-3-phosphate dehydrogenase [Steroidobacteraceae bacterium]|nr:glycerol-3-phosphate dehydrogenase [Steroidobacteraceae bacterium]